MSATAHPLPLQLPRGSPWHKLPTPMVLGEAPIYRSADSTLHWVDPLKEPPELHIIRVDPVSGSPVGAATTHILEESVSVVCFRRRAKGYICAYYAGIALLDEDTGELSVLEEIIGKEDRSQRRFNDGGVDAMGRFWAAEIDKKAVAYGLGGLPESYGPPKGRLWRYDPDGSLHLILSEGLVCGNGVDWSPDNKTFYLNDSVGQKSYSYDFDLDTGSITNKRLLNDTAGTLGEPDGLVIDCDGNIWMSVYGSSRVMVFSPDGKHLKDVQFSAKNLTCPTWGGKHFDRLYITSASGSRAETEDGDEGGHLFTYTEPGLKGAAKYEFAG